MEQIELFIIMDAIQRHGGNKKEAASELGIGYSTLKIKLRTWITP